MRGAIFLTAILSSIVAGAGTYFATKATLSVSCPAQVTTGQALAPLPTGPRLPTTGGKTF